MTTTGGFPRTLCSPLPLVLCRWAALLACLLLAACGPRQHLPPGSAPEQAAARPLPRDPAGFALPAPHSLLAEPSRTAQSAGTMLLRRDGADWDPAFTPRNTVDGGSSLILVPAWIGEDRYADTLAIALYRFNLSGFTGQQSLRLQWSTVGFGTDCYLALADFELNRWRFFNTGVAQGVVNIGPELLERYRHSGSGELLAAVCCSGAAEWTLDSIRVGQEQQFNPLGVELSHPAYAGSGVSLFPQYSGSIPMAYEWDLSALGQPLTRSSTAHVPLFQTPGSFACSLVMRDGNGEPHLLPFVVDVGAADQQPAVVESVYPGLGRSGDELEFHALLGRGAAPVVWHWDFGGGAVPNSSTEQLPVITLGSPGQYEAQLTVETASGVATSHSFVLRVEGPDALMYPPRLHGVLPSNLRAQNPCTLSVVSSGGGIYEYEWTSLSPALVFNQPAAAEPAIILPPPGIYHGRVTVGNSAGSASRPFRLLVASQEAGSLNPPSQNSYWSGVPDSLFWSIGPPPPIDPPPFSELTADFGSAGSLDLNMFEPGQPGIYHCCRFARGGDYSSALWFTLHVRELLPPDLSNVSVSPVGPPGSLALQIQEGQLCQARAVNYGGPVDAWDWQFTANSDPPSSESAVQLLSFIASGSFACSVQASNSKGSSSLDFTVDVSPAPPPYIQYAMPVMGTQHTQTTFDAGTSGGYVKDWEWNFGGGATPGSSTERNPTVTLGAAGVYFCSVKAGNGGGSSTFNFILNIQPPQPPRITGVSPASAVSGEPVDFQAAWTQGEPDSWSWDFGGGGDPNTSSDAAPQVTALAPGSYNCSVTASNAGGSHQFNFVLVVE